jgi:arylsulfatase A-like enzyme
MGTYSPCYVPRKEGQVREMKKPNVLFVFADQLRYTALGCSGNRIVQTPNIDRLGREGMIFDQAYASCPICSPYRGQILTGKYPHINGVVCNEYRFFDDQVTLPQLLEPHGYRSAYVGKWHLGYGPYSEHKRYGFTDLYAYNGMGGRFDVSYWHNETGPMKMVGYEPKVETELALEYLKSHGGSGRPVCIVMSWQPPHWTLLGKSNRRYGDYPQQHNVYSPDDIELSENVPLQFRDFARREITDYYGTVTSLDACVGRILDELDRSGLTDNTIVCFSSDHGDHLSSHGYGTPADSWMHHTLQGSKATPYDESCHIPFLIRYPDRIGPNRRSDTFFSSVDVLPTLLELCDIAVPEDVQGTSLAPIMLGSASDGPDSVYLQILGPGWPTRSKWLGLWRGVRNRDYLYARWKDLGGRRLLIDLKRDPAELDNLIDNPEYAEAASRMERLLQTWIEKTRDPFDTGKRLPDTDMLDLGQAFTTNRWLSKAPTAYAQAIADNHRNFTTGEQESDPQLPQR